MKEGLQIINEGDHSSFVSRFTRLFTSETGLLHPVKRREYKRRRKNFIDAPFSPMVRPELFTLPQPGSLDPNIIEGEFREVETPQLSEPQSPDQ